MIRPREWGRRLLRSARLRQAACWVIHLYIRFVFATNRWTIEGGETPRRLRAAGKQSSAAHRANMRKTGWSVTTLM